MYLFQLGIFSDLDGQPIRQDGINSDFLLVG
jgi:hypothetical protein